LAFEKEISSDHDGVEQQEDDQDLANVARDQVEHKLADVGVNDVPFFDGRDNAGIVVIGQHHCRRFLTYISTGNTHSHTYVSFLKSGGIVYTIPCHCNYVVFFPQFINNFSIYQFHLPFYS
jgi:hypothetical protein